MLAATSGAQQKKLLQVDFYGDSLAFLVSTPDTVDTPEPVTELQIKKQVACLERWNYQPLLDSLLIFKKTQLLDDWIYYQLIRKTSQQIFAKENNYKRYTVLKWFLLTRSGYDASLKIEHNRLLFYIQTDEAIFNMPYYLKYGKQYVCLNYHDYGYFEVSNEKYPEIDLPSGNADKSFSYKVTKIPEGKDIVYIEKELQFNYYESVNHFKIKLNPNIRQMFSNYPVVDYASYFNIPLSRETYQSLIPALKNYVAKMKDKDGVDFLMRFTRYAFLFETDTDNFGREKRLTPEQTILYKYSDCEDRAALFFYLVKEIYCLPMIVLAYPNHITIAVKLKKPVGKPIFYNGEEYTVAEPTPQQDDLELGKTLPSLIGTNFEVVYVFRPPVHSH
ncbi:MAG: hypothetical protein IPP72_17970 [Chitinophagaceae bacterium]|nr:hypothetical protein [Chitinophagaceae bacterium]